MGSHPIVQDAYGTKGWSPTLAHQVERTGGRHSNPATQQPESDLDLNAGTPNSHVKQISALSMSFLTQQALQLGSAKSRIEDAAQLFL